jgi:hypothetical protein
MSGEGDCCRFELLERVQTEILPLIGIAALCRDLAAQRIFALIGSGDGWAGPAAQLGDAIATRLGEDAVLLLEVDHELDGLFGPEWYHDENLPKWLV